MTDKHSLSSLKNNEGKGGGDLEERGEGLLTFFPWKGGGLIREGDRLNRGFTITGITDRQLCLLMYDNYCKQRRAWIIIWGNSFQWAVKATPINLKEVFWILKFYLFQKQNATKIWFRRGEHKSGSLCLRTWNQLNLRAFLKGTCWWLSNCH